MDEECGSDPDNSEDDDDVFGLMESKLDKKRRLKRKLLANKDKGSQNKEPCSIDTERIAISKSR